jgi:hypothetical protein
MIRYHPEVEKMFSRNKYHNKKLDTEDGKFDSKYEYQKWCELKLLDKIGEISGLCRQVPIKLIPSMKLNGMTIRETSYIADFMYKKEGVVYIVDTKGFETPEYKIKKKLLIYKYVAPDCGTVFMECKKGKPDKIYK